MSARAGPVVADAQAAAPGDRQAGRAGAVGPGEGQERTEGSVVSQPEIVHPAPMPAGPPQEWLDAMKTIWGQAIELLHQRRLYRLIRDMVLRNPALPKESVVYDWISTGYVYTAAMTVRRLVDLSKGTISLRRLLEQIAVKPTGITRAWFVEKYDPRLREVLPGQDRASADRDFDELTGACGPHASADVVKADCEILRQAAETIKRYTDEHLAPPQRGADGAPSHLRRSGCSNRHDCPNRGQLRSAPDGGGCDGAHSTRGDGGRLPSPLGPRCRPQRFDRTTACWSPRPGTRPVLEWVENQFLGAVRSLRD